MKIITIVVGPLETNCYIIVGKSGEAAVIDPGADAAKIIETLEKEKSVCSLIALTHAHADHIGAVKHLKEKYGAPIYAHPLEFASLVSTQKNLSAHTGDFVSAPPADKALTDGKTLTLGDVSLEIMCTPGHTSGGICLITRDKNSHIQAVFSGDTIFRDTVGRCDLPGGDEDAMASSIAKFLAMKGDPDIYPGHGPATTLSREKLSNPYFKKQ
ncbi:MAG: MBL fold metallo-hydrolase [Endomicrobiia bacterium]|nr:MBL fold metallo-hydrolase [Endomicrobiia bacterium]